MWRGTTNADLCQLTWSTKHVLLQKSSSSPSVTMTSITSGSAELHTKHYIYAASRGRISLTFFNGISKQEIRIPECVREHQVSVRVMYPLGIRNDTRSEAPQSSEEPSFAWVYFWSN